MRGHESILGMRTNGMRPPIVFLNDYPCQTDWATYGEHATVNIDGDALSSMDFRFLVGLMVNISSTCEKRGAAIFEKVKAAGASIVALGIVQPDKSAWEQSGTAVIWAAPVNEICAPAQGKTATGQVAVSINQR